VLLVKIGTELSKKGVVLEVNGGGFDETNKK